MTVLKARKGSETILNLRYRAVSARTAGSEVKVDAKLSAQMKITTAIMLVTAMPRPASFQPIISALSGSLAPRFWPTMTDAAMLSAKAGRNMIASIRSPLAIDAKAVMLAPFNLPRILNRSILARFQATWRNPAGHPILKMVLIVSRDTAPKLV